MIRELIEERMTANPVRCVLGKKSPVHDHCPPNCCKPAPRPPSNPTGAPA
jgi:hypothetical protein